jgi:Methionyl-tRNA synthetase
MCTHLEYVICIYIYIFFCRISQDLFLQLYENGFLSKDFMEQLHCENCDRYLADRFVEGICPRCGYEDARGDQCDGCGHLVNATELISPRCKICQKMPLVTKSEQFFLELPKVSSYLLTSNKILNESAVIYQHCVIYKLNIAVYNSIDTRACDRKFMFLEC